ncbi:hypothetical protein AB4156_45530, partial [Cupriavidus sp. 2MCAB6]|uniref:hypothetical protein n=1 Tax=Cupriavidus sp. 2MCAB6 TaxID=3232981 RepID=UPI003F8E4F8A
FRKRLPWPRGSLKIRPLATQLPRCKAGGTRVAGLAGWLAARKARRTEVKKPVDETLIALHNLVSLLQKTQ